jgi:O-antigen/teichoic acid export membrane protein
MLFVYVWGLRKQIFPFVRPHLSNIKYIIRLSYPYLGMSIIGYSILFAGAIIISNQLGAKEFAIYRNGAIEIPFFATLYSSITSIAMPRIVQLTNTGKIQELMILKRKISNTVAALIYPVVFFCIINGNVFMKLYLGDKYISSGIIFSIYNIVLLFRINTYSDILTIRKKPNKIIIPNLIALLVTLTGTFVLVYLLGIKGAAIAFIISLMLLSAQLIYNSCKEIGISIYQYFDYIKPGKIALISLVFSLISVPFLKAELLSFAGISILYFIIVYLYVFKLNLVDQDSLPIKIQRLIIKLNFKWSIG